MKLDRLFAPWVPCLLVAGAALAAAEPALQVSPGVFETHLARLASDEFEGRKPATRGEELTVAYLSEQFAKLGLQPGNRGSYVQPVPLLETAVVGDPSIMFTTAAGKRAGVFGEDAVIFTKREVPESRLVDSPIVFVGHGIVAPELGWNDYAGLDMRGKTALILINEPGFSTGDETLFRGRALTYYGRWTYKFEEAARQGAAGAIIVHETEPAAYGWPTVVNSWANPQLDTQSADGNAGRVAIEGWITEGSARSLLASQDLDFDALKKQASTRGFRAVPLDAKVDASVRNLLRRSNSANVIATIPGAKYPDEYVFYVAHWDHLGRALGGQGDATFNGAVDNATGVAGLLAIADAFAKAKEKPERTVVFLAVTAEEQGLLGSAWYVANPIFPLAQTVAVFNMDALYFADATRDVPVIGYGASELEGDLEKEAARRGLRVSPDPLPEKGYFYRSDHFNFAKAGVPALYIKTGIDDPVGGVEAGRAREADFVAHRYHQVGDNYVPGESKLDGPLQVVDLFHVLGRELANERKFPNWNPDSEFRAARDASRPQEKK